MSCRLTNTNTFFFRTKFFFKNFLGITTKLDLDHLTFPIECLEIKELKGNGNFANVYRGILTFNKGKENAYTIEVAVKRIKKDEDNNDEQTVFDFMKEAANMR